MKYLQSSTKHVVTKDYVNGNRDLFTYLFLFPFYDL